MKKETILQIITYLIAAVFLVIHILQENTEFLGHLAAAIIFFWIALYVYKKYNYPFVLLVGFVLWFFLHLLGGTDIMGVRVYSVIFFDLTGAPLYFLKYDQIMHFYCYLVIAPIIYFIAKKEVKKMTPFALVLILLAGIGVGAMNEILEFTMVMTIPNTGVGDYFNNAFDLVMNGLGAVVGILWAHLYSTKKK